MGLFDNDRAEQEAQEPDQILEDGIYFDMPELTYHRLHRLSASGIKNILISAPTFWAKSWMNPDAEEQDDDTKAKILGRAYHVAIFEPETLDARYVAEPDLDQYENLLTSDSAVCAELKALGQTQKKANESQNERASRLLDLDPSFNIKSLIISEWEETLEGRTSIAAKYWQQIQRDIERIEANPEIHNLVTGGASEVTILWTCPESGIKMKARIDKLKEDCFVDLKSFQNANGKPVNQAILDQVQYLRQYLSMRVYQTAIRMIGELSLEIMGITDQEEAPSVTQEQINLVETLRSRSGPHQPWLFFQEKNGIPNLLARRVKLQDMPDGVDEQSIGAEDHVIKIRDTVLCRKADIEIARAKQIFTQSMEIFGEDSPWYPFDMIGTIGDEDFRDWFLNGMPA